VGVARLQKWGLLSSNVLLGQPCNSSDFSAQERCVSAAVQPFDADKQRCRVLSSCSEHR